MVHAHDCSIDPGGVGHYCMWEDTKINGHEKEVDGVTSDLT